jgi:hypothetical protein
MIDSSDISGRKWPVSESITPFNKGRERSRTWNVGDQL